MIGVVDYRAGNAPSVLYALEQLGLAGAAGRLTPPSVAAAERIILPGVGAARATIDSLGRAGPGRARSPTACVDDGVPFLGICIGLQVLFDHSEEGDSRLPRLGAGRGPAVPRHRPRPADRLEPGAVHACAPAHAPSCPTTATSTS